MLLWCCSLTNPRNQLYYEWKSRIEIIFVPQGLAMERTTVERQKLVEVVSTLPDEALFELASFLDYLSYKSLQRRTPTRNAANFLFAVAGLGRSGQSDISERDEEILRNEIDPVYGWNLKHTALLGLMSHPETPRFLARQSLSGFHCTP